MCGWTLRISFEWIFSSLRRLLFFSRWILTIEHSTYECAYEWPYCTVVSCTSINFGWSLACDLCVFVSFSFLFFYHSIAYNMLYPVYSNPNFRSHHIIQWNLLTLTRHRRLSHSQTSNGNPQSHTHTLSHRHSEAICYFIRFSPTFVVVVVLSFARVCVCVYCSLNFLWMKCARCTRTAHL